MKIAAALLLLCLSSLTYAQEHQSLRTIQTHGFVVTANRPLVAGNNTALQSTNFSLCRMSSTMDQRYCIPGLSIAECSDNLNTEQIFLRGFDCDGIIQFQEVVAALRLRSIDDRPETEENLLPVKTYTVFDLSAVYQFETVELFVVIENIFNEAWNEAQFETASQLWGESPDIASELQLTAGSPRSVRMGLAYHF